MKTLPRLTLALAVSLFATGVQATETDKLTPPPPPSTTENGIQVGVGVICNSHQQVERYLAVKEQSSVESAIDLVNQEVNDKQACGLAMIAFVTGDRIGDVRVSDGTMHVTRITILAVATDTGWFRIPETVQYTAFLEKLESI